MPTSVSIRKNLYKDSVALMRIAQAALAGPGVTLATLLMATPGNLQILRSAGLFRPELEEAHPGDVMICVDAESTESLEAAVAGITELLEGERPAASGGQTAAIALHSVAMGCAHAREAALAQISVPGPYAAAEALKALRQGLHIFLFSDNVSLEHERAIKAVARDKGLLVMGPDCGTAIIGGVPLGFANRVRQGAISLVGASGTGLQEVTSRIDSLGQGIRHAIGTGGRDVYAEIGGSTMRQAIDLLAADPGTRLIGVVSKPPAPEVARQILAQLAATGKPAVVLFLGADLSAEVLPANVVLVSNLRDAAFAAVALLQGQCFVPSEDTEESRGLTESELQRFAPGQSFVRGLYSGGTFCTEAQLIWRGLGLRVYSNAPLDKSDVPIGVPGNLALDLGGDEFTVGRPHPMIDPAARIERILQEANDPTTAVIVIDVVLGYAGHENPAGVLATAIVQAKAICAESGRHLSILAFVCGTEADPQRLSVQQALLRQAGAIVLPDCTTTARMAGEIGKRAAASAPRSTLERIAS
jgi:succinyl-CoA synthetase alpha subunit